MWKQGQRSGPTAPLLHDMAEMMDSNLMVLMHEPRKHTKAMGTDSLPLLMPSGPADPQHEGADTSSLRVLLSGVNEDSDTVFLLMGPEGERPMGNSTYSGLQYHLMKLDFMYDDTCRRITAITHRVTQHAGNPKAVPLPLKHVRPLPATGHATILAPSNVHSAMQAWCMAMSSGSDPNKVMSPYLDPDFQLWDAYGVTCQRVGTGVTPPSLVPCMVGRDAAMSHLAAEQTTGTPGMSVECRLMDYATSMDMSAAFCHWISTTSTTPSAGRAPPVGMRGALKEGMQVMLFDNDGRLSDVWMFSDA